MRIPILVSILALALAIDGLAADLPRNTPSKSQVGARNVYVKKRGKTSCGKKTTGKISGNKPQLEPKPKPKLGSPPPSIPAPAPAPIVPGRGQDQGQEESCPDIHIFGARETTAPPGFGTASVLVDLVLNTKFPGAGSRTVTSEAIDYPAAGGKDYGASVGEGIKAVVNQTNIFSARCPRSVIIMHGYSQGAQIMDDAFCGGPDLPSLNSSETLVSRQTAENTAAIIFMGNPRHVDGLPFNVGNATAGGFAARPPGFRCPVFEDRIQAYCDSPDPFCSNGNDPATHQGYGDEYGDDVLRFIIGRLGG